MSQYPRTTFRSSQDFIRALKSPSDPPVPKGPYKIEIVEEAWLDQSFYVPSKAATIAEWILAKFLKEKGKEIALNPVFDARYWQLILSLTAPEGSNPKNADNRPVKTWLTPVLQRIPLGPVVVSFLTSFNDVQVEDKLSLAGLVSSSLSILWPIAMQRMSIELLQECFGALLSHLSHATNEGIARIGRLVCTSYRNSLANSSNKKKLHQSFLQSHLRHWLRSTSVHTEAYDQNLKSSVLDAGTETLFNLDILRQSHDSKSENTLLDHLQKIAIEDQDLVLDMVPTIFEHYVHALVKHRGALFSQGSQTQPGAALKELRDVGMSFFTSIVTLLDDSLQNRLSWESRLSLLQTVDRENLFNQKQRDAGITFNRILDLVLEVLNDSWKMECSECVALAVQCLSTIGHIDYDLVSPIISSLLPRLLEIPIAGEAHFAFLNLLLLYHSKTRTMSTLAENLFASFSAPHKFRGSSGEAYQIYFSSPIMHTLHLNRLSKALQNFTTESQCLPLVEYVFDTLRNSWERWYSSSRSQGNQEGPVRKKRKSITVEDDTNWEELAVTYSLVAGLASVVLSSFPAHSLASSTLDEVRSLLVVFRSKFIHHAILKSIKIFKEQADIDIWPSEIAIAANLRLLYAMDVSRNMTLPSQTDTKLHTKLAELVANNGQLPELTLEMFRVLLYNLSLEATANHEEIIESLLEYLEKNFSPSAVHWSGQSYHLTKGEPGNAESALAIMHMLIERWLPEIDSLSSPAQLKRLLTVIMSIDLFLAIHPGQSMQPEQLLLQLLHSAQFWEFRNIRSVLLDVILETSAPLDHANSKPLKPSTLLEKVSLYRLLLLFPMEYFSWQHLNDLTKRGLLADVALTQLSAGQDRTSFEASIVLRVFLKRAYVYSGSLAQESNQDQSQFLTHLLKEQELLDSDTRVHFTRVTLDLADIYFLRLLKASKKNGPESILKVLPIFTSESLLNSRGISSSSFIGLVDLLTKEFLPDSIHVEILVALRKLHANLSASLLPHLNAITEGTIQEDDLRRCIVLVSGWYSLLCLEKWFGSSEHSAPPFIAGKLVSVLMPCLQSQPVAQIDELDHLCVNIFAVLLQEFHFRTEAEHAQQLDFIVAIYISFADFLHPAGLTKMDLYLGKAFRKMNQTDYVHLLSLIPDSLSDLKDMSPAQRLHLVQLASLLLREHPSHTLSHIQKFATRCIGIFTGNSIFVEGSPKLRLQVLEMVAQHCSDQQSALRSLDAAGIWLLVSKFLAPCQDHDQDTQVDIFHKIIMILSSLIRLRRDLVALALPHLGMILRQLLLSMRGCRPHLGAKQTTLMMNTQPRWISAAHPLGPEEAKALGRLLESLNTKTTVRVPTSSPLETQKAESLAKPFSKHAAYVLKAYIEAMNDPLCILPLDVRKELQPGLFALGCMMNEHSRDALMISALDAGGKATLKVLWREYDKQRYVGRG